MAENQGVILVAPYSPEWATQFAAVKRDLEASLAGVRVVAIEHVGSTAVPGLAAKPVLDIDVIVHRDYVQAAITALQQAGYRHTGDLGFPDREALLAPDDSPRRHVYVCTTGTLHVRNHLAVRKVLRTRPTSDLRDAYASVKQTLASDPTMTIEQYLDGKTDILQQVLAAADLTDLERQSILRLNAPARTSTSVTRTTEQPSNRATAIAPPARTSQTFSSPQPRAPRRLQAVNRRRPHVASVTEVDRSVRQVDALPPGIDHEEAREHLEREGWTLLGRGDWAIALQSPDRRLAARISPFDPTSPYTAALYRAGRGTGWFPELHLELPLDGGANLLLMELLHPVDIATGAAIHQRLSRPDAAIASAAALIQQFHRDASEALPWCGPVDDNPANIMRATDGSLRITDPYYADGPALYDTLLTDPDAVARAIPPHARRHILDIPLSGSGSWDPERREQMRSALARADSQQR